jgi:hypothetical protein
MSGSSTDDRNDRLKDLSQTLGENNNRQDKAGMMSQLSQEFEWHMQIAEEYATKKYFGGAEALRLIAESIHGTLSTFEAIEE